MLFSQLQNWNLTKLLTCDMSSSKEEHASQMVRVQNPYTNDYSQVKEIINRNSLE